MIQLPDEIIHMIKTIESASFEVYAVGGCIRDMILSCRPKDWDLTTNAPGEKLMELFPDAEIINRNLGVMRVSVGGLAAEIAEYRVDGEYRDYRRPETVCFTQCIDEDLRRRDFTMNAIAVNPFRGEIDLFQGRDDIRHRLIRGIGNPRVRFEEDALRILRGIRFSAQLDFEVEAETLLAMGEKSYLLSHISMERILEEYHKTLISNRCSRGLELFRKTGAWEYILGNGCFARAGKTELDRLLHLEKGIDRTERSLPVRLALVYLCFARENALAAIGYLGHSNEIKKRMLLAVENLDGLEMIRSAGDLKRFASSVGLDAYFYLEDLAAQRCAALGMDRTGCRERTAMYERIIENDEPVYLADLAVNGRDLIEIGIKEGIGLGRTLTYLLDYVHENPNDNKKKLLLDLAYAFGQTENDRG